MSKDNKTSVGISIENVTKSFQEHTVLKSLNLTVQPGEIFVLMGPSGTGKSVLLKILSGLDQQTEGQIRIGEYALSEVVKNHRYVLGLVFQAGALFNSMSVFDNLALYFQEHELCDEIEIAKRITNVLHLLNLDNTEELMPSNLSGGMKKRVALARGLLMQPDVLLFDEPTSELDPTTAASIIELIGFVNKKFGITTIIASHDLLLAQNIADHIGVLQNGSIQQIYTPDTLLSSTDPFIQNFVHPTIHLNSNYFNQLLS